METATRKSIAINESGLVKMARERGWTVGAYPNEGVWYLETRKNDRVGLEEIAKFRTLTMILLRGGIKPVHDDAAFDLSSRMQDVLVCDSEISQNSFDSLISSDFLKTVSLVDCKIEDVELLALRSKPYLNAVRLSRTPLTLRQCRTLMMFPKLAKLEISDCDVESSVLLEIIGSGVSDDIIIGEGDMSDIEIRGIRTKFPSQRILVMSGAFDLP
ncbi:MAG: hypothetical protein JNM18_02330 [Planctomycetaceae bacterium]|nr:hypothetical protein [Planctomycetaceae bacterium]